MSSDMQRMVDSLRDLAHSLSEYPAEWPDDLLAEVDNLAAMVKGCVQTERLIRAAAGYDDGTDADVRLVSADPSVFPDAPPIRTYSDGTQVYGPYSKRED